MINRLSRLQVRWLVLLGAALAYFVIYPEDLALVLGPLTPVSKAAAEVFSVSQAVSPGLYALAAVVVICWALLRVATRLFQLLERRDAP